MGQFLTLPILVPVVLGIALLIFQPRSRKVRSGYIMAASLMTTALSLACIVLTYLYGSGYLACIMVSFNEAFSISLRIDSISSSFNPLASLIILMSAPAVYARSAEKEYRGTEAPFSEDAPQTACSLRSAPPDRLTRSWHPLWK